MLYFSGILSKLKNRAEKMKFTIEELDDSINDLLLVLYKAQPTIEMDENLASKVYQLRRILHRIKELDLVDEIIHKKPFKGGQPIDIKPPTSSK